MKTYKAISIWQPWASLIVSGAKTIETRTWPPRGLRVGEPVLIHAAKHWTEDEREMLDDPVFRIRLTQAAFRGLWDFDAPPLGCLVAVATFNGAQRSEDLVASISMHERWFGAYAPGNWGWRFVDVRPIKPIPWRGAQGLFPVVIDEARLEYVEARG